MRFAMPSMVSLGFVLGCRGSEPIPAGTGTDSGRDTPAKETGTVPGPFVEPASSTVAYVANRDENTISEVSLLTGEVVDTIALPPTGDPSFPGPVRLAVSPDGSRVAATSGYQVHVVETSTNEVRTFDLQNVGPLAFSPTPDVVLLFDRFRGAVIPFDLQDPSPLESLDDSPRSYARTDSSPEGWDLHPTTDELFVPDRGGRSIERCAAEVSRGEISAPAESIETIASCDRPGEIVVASTGAAYVACSTAGTIEVIDLADATRESIPDFAAERPIYLDISRDETLLAVIESGGRVGIIDLERGVRIGRWYDAGPSPFDVAFTPDGRHVAVVSREGRDPSAKPGGRGRRVG